MIRRALLSIAAVLLTGCYVVRFTVSYDDSEPEPVVKHNAYYFWGLTSQDVDVSQYCAYGAVAVDEELAFWDSVLGTVTAGIYAPRTAYYWCRLEPGHRMRPKP
ncbi:MAG TPA: hypothetical protein VMR86_03190 [Myxococcota bacterium]|nr:hypothetical protein [Myxococcota bacterium]